MPQKSYSWCLSLKNYLRFLASQGVAAPAYPTLLSWNQFMTAYGDVYPRNLAAYYPNDASALYLDGSNNVILWEDRSGNSATNCLVLDGVAGNYASRSDFAFATSEVELVARIAMNDWTPSGLQAVVAKDNDTNQRSLLFGVNASGHLSLSLSADGSALTTVTSGVATSFSDMAAGWVKATWRASDGRTQFFTAPDQGSEPSSWTQLGTNQIGLIANIFDSTTILTVGAQSNGTGNRFSGRAYRVIVRGTIDGASIFDANFARVAKLATSFTESSSNAATVTVNTSGATGARISGERDLYQGTAAQRPAYTAAAGGNRLSVGFDGSNDYLKAAPFSLSQPETIYFAGKQVSWASGRNIYDGGGAGGHPSVGQRGVSPALTLYAGSADTASNSNLAIGATGLLSSVFNGASSSNRVNGGTAVTGNPGSGASAGFTVAAYSTGSGGFANITASEVAIYAEAHNTATQNNLIAYWANKFGISL